MQSIPFSTERRSWSPTTAGPGSTPNEAGVASGSPSPAELTWCVEALLEPSTHDAFADQGRAYAEAEYGSTDRFIDRVVEGCGLASAAVPARITA